MDALLQQIEYWHWLTLALALLVLEVFAPGVVFLWLGLAAGAVGLLFYLDPALSWQDQFLAFAVLGLASVALGRWWLGRHPIQTDEPQLNRRGEQYVGRVFTLAAPIVNGEGKVRVDDTTWKVHGPDLPAGEKIRVTAVDGVVLRIKRVHA